MQEVEEKKTTERLQNKELKQKDKEKYIIHYMYVHAV